MQIAGHKDNALTTADAYEDLMLGNIRYARLTTMADRIVSWCNTFKYPREGVTGIALVGAGVQIDEMWITKSPNPTDKTTYYALVFKRD